MNHLHKQKLCQLGIKHLVLDLGTVLVHAFVGQSYETFTLENYVSRVVITAIF